MKSTLSLLLLTCFVILYSCGNEKKKTPVPKEGEARLFAVVTNPDSTKRAAIVLRIIKKSIKTDSLKGVDRIVYDTTWGAEREVPMLDSLKSPIIDSVTKKPKMITGWFVISKDSVNTKVQDIPLDSLLKK